MANWKTHPVTGDQYIKFRWKAQLGVNRRAKVQRKLDTLIGESVHLPEKLIPLYYMNFIVTDSKGQVYNFFNGDDDTPAGGLYYLVKR